MDINKRYLLYAILGLQLLTVCRAQSSFQFGILPSFNVNSKFQNDWMLTSKLESRNSIHNSDVNGNSDTGINYILTDLSFVVSKKINHNSRIAGGYLIRYEDGYFFHRLIQQYTIVQKMNSFSLSHRFSSDQTLSKAENPTFRLRYRIASELPLNGESVEPNEFYLKLNNEYLNSWQQSDHDLEIRLIPLLGYEITGNNKIEIGLDYRLSSIFKNNTEHNLWMSINWFIEI